MTMTHDIFSVATPASTEHITEPACGQPQTSRWDVFISHSSEDMAFVRPCVTRLREADISYWLDSESISRGASYAEEIMRGIEGSSILLLLYSANVAAKPDDVLNEIENAKRMGKELIPIRLDRTEYTKAFQYYLNRIQWIDAAGKDESSVFEELIESIRNKLPKWHASTIPVSEQDAETGIAASHNVLSKNLFDQAHYGEAADEGEKAVSIYRALAERHMGSFREELRLALFNEGCALLSLNRLDEAEPLFSEALVLARDLAEDESPRHLSDLADTLDGCAILHSRRRGPALVKARKAVEEALSIRKGLAFSHPAQFEAKYAESLVNAGGQFLDMKRRFEAKSVWKEAIAICRRRVSERPSVQDNYNLAGALANLAGLRHVEGRMDDLIREADEAIGILRPLVEANPSRYGDLLARALYNRAAAPVSQQQWVEADALLFEAFELALACAERNPEGDEPLFQCVWKKRLDILRISKINSEAIGMMVRVVSLYREISPHLLADVLMELGGERWKAQETADAEHCYGESVSLYRDLLQKPSSDVAKEIIKASLAKALFSMYLIHECDEQKDRRDEAARELREAQQLDPAGTAARMRMMERRKANPH